MENEFDENNEEGQFDTPPDHDNLKIMPPIIYLGFLGLSVLAEIVIGSNLSFRWSAQLTLGILLISLGSGLISWCIFLFSNKGTHIETNKPTLVLITDGPYWISRNPIYLGMNCIYLGLVILFDIIWGLPIFIPLLYVLQRNVIDREEKYLSRKFRGQYSEYCATTRRWL